MRHVIRAARAADAPVLTRIARAAKAHWGYATELLDGWATDLAITPAYIESHEVIVAVAGETILGVGALEEHGTHRQLAHLWVLPEAQGTGVGSALLAHLRATAGGRPGPLIVESDPHAARFYERRGGVRTGQVPAPIPSEPERSLPVFEFRVRSRED